MNCAMACGAKGVNRRSLLDPSGSGGGESSRCAQARTMKRGKNFSKHFPKLVLIPIICKFGKARNLGYSQLPPKSNRCSEKSWGGKAARDTANEGESAWEK